MLVKPLPAKLPVTATVIRAPNPLSRLSTLVHKLPPPRPGSTAPNPSLARARLVSYSVLLPNDSAFWEALPRAPTCQDPPEAPRVPVFRTSRMAYRIVVLLNVPFTQL